MSALSKGVGKVRALPVSEKIQNMIISFLIGKVVPFVGTAGLQVMEITEKKVVLSLKNKRKVRNHMKSVHASAIGLLAEACTGMLLTMNLPDSCKFSTTSILSKYEKFAKGAVTATAVLTDEQMNMINHQDKGEITFEVDVIDSNKIKTSVFEVTWAWKKK